MQLKFTKMHGLGNDFMVIDGIAQSVTLDTRTIQALSNRHTGIGFDQLLLVETASDARADFKYRIFNADGDEVEQCGNGVRCFARFVFDKGLTDKQRIVVETCSGLVSPELQANGLVTVDMGKAHFAPESLPFLDSHAQRLERTYSVTINGQTITFGAVSVGNPHAVIQVEDIDAVDVASIGSAIQQHAAFPKSVNVGFMQVVDSHTIKLRVYERGVGETQACGTGACAAVVVGQHQGLLSDDVTVQLAGGNLKIQRTNANAPIMMTGDAVTVFDGVIELGVYAYLPHRL